MIRAREIAHVGSIECTALVVSTASLGEATARARVLDLWKPGTVVHTIDAGYVVTWPTARRLDAARAPGTPLVERRIDGVTILSGAPFGASTLRRLSLSNGAIVLARAGAVVVEPAPPRPTDVAKWIDLAAFREVEAVSLGEPPPDIAKPSSVTKPARSLLGVGDAPPFAADVARALAAAGAAGAGHASESPLRAIVARASAWTLSLLAALASRVPSVGARAAKRSSRGLAVRDAPDAGPGALAALAAKLQTWLARALVSTRLARFIGRRQAEYVGNLLDLFDHGDLEEALRRAIPLAKGGGSGAPSPALGVPGMRGDLSISPTRTRASQSMSFGPDLFSHLRQVYEQAVERLVREGRFEEAAFVLAELLQDDERAVAFLEKHGELRRAAELAEGRKLAPGIVVRQWFIAGDRERAVRVAMRAGAFADAIMRLERANRHDAARDLRLLWADRLASTGDFAGAVDAASAVPVARALVLRWIDLAIERGGAAGARMLARRVQLAAAVEPEVIARARELLGAEGSEARHLRSAFARSLVQRPGGALVAPVARATYRALAADSAGGCGPILRDALRDVLRIANDSALSTDQITITGARERTLPVLRFSAADRGTMDVRDAAVLPRGRTVVALGEAGVRILDRRGRVARSTDQPTDCLVVSDFGDRAIALAKRDHVYRLARLDLEDGRSELWGEARLAAFAPTFDGSTWVIATSRHRDALVDIVAVDAALDGLEQLYAYDGVGAHVEALARSSERCEALVRQRDGRPEVFSLRVPTFTLRGRGDAAGLDGRDAFVSAVSATGILGSASVTLQDDADAEATPVLGPVALSLCGETRAVTGRIIGPAGEEPLALELGREAVAVLLRSKAGLRVWWIPQREAAHAGEIHLEGARRGGIRLRDDSLVVFDDLGRIIAVDPSTGEMLRDARL